MRPAPHFLQPVILGMLLVVAMPGCSRNAAPPPAQIAGFDTIKKLPAAQLVQLDVAQLNLLCAQGLPGCEQVDVPGAIAQLEQWAARVRAETQRHQYRFERSPAEFESSRGFYRMLMLGVVLAEDFKVCYRADRRVGPEGAGMDDGFFADARDVFLPGLLGEARAGTCSSMPVLYVAVGRRLGYPLKLVTTKGHLFVRWDGEGEQFNVEVTGNGLNRFPDAYYWTWPFAVTEGEVEAEGYLQSLTAEGELAVFLSIRAMCLRERGRMAEAAEAFGLAAVYAPQVRSYRLMEARCRGMAAGSGANRNREESL